MLSKILIAVALFVGSILAAWGASSTLSGLSPGVAISNTDLFYDVQAPGTGGVKVTGTQLLSYVFSNMSGGCTSTTSGVLTCSSTPTSIVAGTNITTSGTATNTTVNVIATPTFTSITTTRASITGWLTASGVNMQTAAIAAGATITFGSTANQALGVAVSQAGPSNNSALDVTGYPAAGTTANFRLWNGSTGLATPAAAIVVGRVVGTEDLTFGVAGGVGYFFNDAVAGAAAIRGTTGPLLIGVGSATSTILVTTTATSFRSALNAPAIAQLSGTTTGYACWTTGTGAISEDSTTCLASLRRLKKDIVPFADATQELMALKPSQFQWKNPVDANQRGQQLGFIAEDVHDVDARLASYDGVGNLHGWRQDAMIAALVRGFQEQQATIRAQQAEIEDLKQRLH